MAIDPLNVPMSAYSPDDIDFMLTDARENLPADDPWRLELEEEDRRREAESL